MKARQIGFCALHGKRTKASDICSDYEPKEKDSTLGCPYYDDGMCWLLGDLAPVRSTGYAGWKRSAPRANIGENTKPYICVDLKLSRGGEAE